MLNCDSLQYKVISTFRFPLSVAIVLLHSNMVETINGGKEYVYFLFITDLFSNIITRIAVPLFFFISGFLFFCKVNNFTVDIYLKKLKKRIRTLLIPYICWVLFVAVLYLLVQIFLPNMISDKQKFIIDYDISDWFWIFWDTNHISSAFTAHLPLNGPLWFLRDLMVVMIFSPLLYVLIKRLYLCIVIILGFLWVSSCWFDIPGFSIDSFFFFSAGAYFGIYKKNFCVLQKLYAIIVLTVFYIALIYFEFYFQDKCWIFVLHNVGILFGMTLAISLCANFVKKGYSIHSFLTDSSFFIYAFHIMPLLFIVKLASRWFHPASNVSLILLYIICPAIVVVIGLGFYWFLKKYMPCLANMLTGGR